MTACSTISFISYLLTLDTAASWARNDFFCSWYATKGNKMDQKQNLAISPVFSGPNYAQILLRGIRA